jgi:hypothetical protein
MGYPLGGAPSFAMMLTTYFGVRLLIRIDYTVVNFSLRIGAPESKGCVCVDGNSPSTESCVRIGSGQFPLRPQAFFGVSKGGGYDVLNVLRMA